MTETRRQTRLRELTNTLNRTVAQREGCIASLVRYEARLLKMRKQLARLGRAMAAAPKPVNPAPAPEVKAELDGAIPAFLDRRKAADLKDAEARARIEAANAERKRAQAERSKIKSQVKKEKLMAKLTGATRKMPLTGKAALAHIKAAG